MDRRMFLQGSLAATVAAGARPLAAQSSGSAPAPAFPPIDTRSVWLVGDAAPTPPDVMAARLATLTQGRGDVGDRYFVGGAPETLERTFATLLGKEDCAIFASGTLANTVAIRVLCGDHPRALVQRESHVYRDESDATQRLSGINLVPIAPDAASPTLDEVAAAIDAAENGPYPLKFGAVSLESPVRRADGEMVPLARVRDIAALARKHGARLHLDGARLLLAPPSVDIGAYAAQFDTVYVSLYKYLGAPFGAVLAGSKDDIAKARDLRHLFGGALYNGWMPALLAQASLPGFVRDIRDAHARADALVARLVASGRVRDRSAQHASNIHKLELSQDLGQAAFERGRQAGIRVGRWREGIVQLHVNTSILRRPLGEYVQVFLG